MARVEIASQGWGWVADTSGNGLGGQSVTIKNLDGSNATHWSAITGGSSSTAAFTSNGDGTIPRFIAPGSYDVTVGSVTRRVEAAAGAPTEVHLDQVGGVGDDSTDNATALSTAVAALPAAGGRVVLGRGTYRASAFPDLTDKRSVIFEGQGGMTGGATEASQLTYTGTGGGTFITAQSTFGVQFRDMMIGHSGAFTGTLIDYSQKSGGLDTQFPGLKGVTLCGTSSNRGATGLKLVKAINGYFEHVNFRDLTTGVLGRSVSGDYSNAHLFQKCRWASIVTAPVKNVGQAWQFNAPTFQQLVSGAAGAITRDSGFTSSGISIFGGWMGDSTSNTGTWIDWAGSGLTVQGCYIGNASVCINMPDNNTRGAHISGNQFIGSGAGAIGTAISMAGTNHTNHFIMGNDFHSTVTTQITRPTSIYGAFVMGGLGLVVPLDFVEITAPSESMQSNTSREWAEDNGAGKTRRMVRFPTGANQQIAIEP